MTTSVPGAPIVERTGTTMRIMFLGGPLDHAIREVPATRGVTLVPPEVYCQGRMERPTWNYQAKAWDPAAPEPAIYHRHRITDAVKRSWFVMILEGYSPPRSHLLDANPYPI